ncbi:hypothetical protein BC834DRAFT_692282 [Gloeopeniophorella convolvens]|nr:hypothetical protein BC834DRAFT_692282 [Gloeopeniophorella convolvens]
MQKDTAIQRQQSPELAEARHRQDTTRSHQPNPSSIPPRFPPAEDSRQVSAHLDPGSPKFAGQPNSSARSSRHNQLLVRPRTASSHEILRCAYKFHPRVRTRTGLPMAESPDAAPFVQSECPPTFPAERIASRHPSRDFAPANSRSHAPAKPEGRT